VAGDKKCKDKSSTNNNQKTKIIEKLKNIWFIYTSADLDNMKVKRKSFRCNLVISFEHCFEVLSINNSRFSSRQKILYTALFLKLRPVVLFIKKIQRTKTYERINYYENHLFVFHLFEIVLIFLELFVKQNQNIAEDRYKIFMVSALGYNLTIFAHVFLLHLHQYIFIIIELFGF